MSGVWTVMYIQCVTFNRSKGKSAVGRIHPLDSHGKLDFSGLTYVDLVTVNVQDSPK